MAIFIAPQCIQCMHLTVLPASPPAQAGAAARHCSNADPVNWNLAPNNANNILADLGAGQVAVEIVAYGPGIGLLKLESVAGARAWVALAASSA